MAEPEIEVSSIGVPPHEIERFLCPAIGAKRNVGKAGHKIDAGQIPEASDSQRDPGCHPEISHAAARCDQGVEGC